MKAPDQLNQHKGCVYSYMKYAEAKLREEEQRALKYLETNVTGHAPSGSDILINKFKPLGKRSY